MSPKGSSQSGLQRQHGSQVPTHLNMPLCRTRLFFVLWSSCLSPTVIGPAHPAKALPTTWPDCPVGEEEKRISLPCTPPAPPPHLSHTAHTPVSSDLTRPLGPAQGPSQRACCAMNSTQSFSFPNLKCLLSIRGVWGNGNYRIGQCPWVKKYLECRNLQGL